MSAAYTMLEKMYAMTGIGGKVEDGILDNGLSITEHAHGNVHGLEHGFNLHDLTRPWVLFKLLGVGEVRNVLFWLAVGVVLLLFAFMTNPTESSFRSHLTELSFRRHLVDIRSSEDTPESHDVPPATPERPNPGGGGPPSTHPSGGTETPPLAPFRFANHVAISLRTPPLLYRTLWIASLAITSPPAPPLFLSDPVVVKKGGGVGSKGGEREREKVVVFLGFMGHWSMVGVVPRRLEWVWRIATRGGGEREKGRKKVVGGERAGVLEMRAVSGKEESTTQTTPKGTLSLSSSISALKLRRSDSSTNIHDNGTLPLHNPTSLPIPTLPSDSRRPSLIPTTAPPEIEITSPLVIALKAELATATSTLSDLQSQLLTHEQTVSDAHSHLQTSLDDLRHRRKEDDLDRQELKSRTKSLEEQKRQAEGARREAEKKLKAVESLRDSLEAKITGGLNEMGDLKGNMEMSERNARMVQEEGARYVIETRELAEGKVEELEGLERVVEGLEVGNEELGRLVKEAEGRLKDVVDAGVDAKKLGPEEEMMMMAAAYEAAAQEGYGMYTGGGGLAGSGGGVGQTVSNHSNSNSNSNSGSTGPTPPTGTGNQWVNQAAAYMAEAGMPYLDHNYTARPSNAISGFGHLAKIGSIDPRQRGGITSGGGGGLGGLGGGVVGDVGGMGRVGGVVGDLSGFEDFGPRAVTPPISESESDIYGHFDPGSPNGGISTSFSANYLPQGLFRSLDGDVTPLGTDYDDDEEEGGSVIEVEEGEDGMGAVGGGQGGDVDDRFTHPTEVDTHQHQNHHHQHQHHHQPHHQHQHHDSASDSSDEHEHEHEHVEREHDIWRSPAPTRLLTSSSITPPHNPALPGLPALPGSRRWFSGTTSNENLSFGFAPPSTSTDSLTSPFAPSASEKKALALKWGPLSKYRWSTPTPAPVPAPASGVHTKDDDRLTGSGTIPSIGLGQPQPQQQGTNWLSSRFPSSKQQQQSQSPLNQSLLTAPNLHNSTSTSTSTSNRLSSSPTDHEQQSEEDDKASSIASDKRSFRFFSLKRGKDGSPGPNGSGGLGSSPRE